MSENNATELIKYLTEDNLKLMYGRLNRRYMIVDALPPVDSLDPADRNVIYVVKETVGGTVRYWPNVIDNDAWKPFGIGQADLDGKADKVDAAEGHLVVSDGNGGLADADIMPGTFVALAIDPSEGIQPHATDLRKIWKAYQSGMPVALLDNRPDGTGLYAQLNAAGYTWADGDRMAECLEDVDDDNRQCDGTVHGYRTESDDVVTFYEDAGHTVEIVPENGKLYCDDTVPDRERVYRYNDGFVRALRFVQFSCNELVDDDPAWPSRRATRQVFYRMTEPYGSSSPDGFEVVYGESTADIHDQMVTGARIGEGKLLPVDAGIIVLPKSTVVNDGKLTVTVGESEPVVFTANDSADRAVDIPVATDEVAGLVRIASAVDPGDPDAAVTAAAVLDELNGYVQKVYGAAAGNIAALTSEGSMSDSGISSEDVEIAMAHVHTHGNKSVLDEVTAPYTMEEHDKLAGIEACAQINVIETVKVDGTELRVANKAVDIDMSGKADKVSGATGGNLAGLDANGNLTDSGSKASDFKPRQSAVTDPTASGSGIEFIDSISQDSDGVIVPTKKSVQAAVASTAGVGGNAGVMSAADKEKLDGIDNYIESASVTGRTLTLTPKAGTPVQFTDTGDANVIERITVNGAEVRPAGKTVDIAVPAVNDARLSIKLGTAAAADTGFSANSATAVTVEIPNATTGVDGLMGSADKSKLDGIETGAQKNSIEKVTADGADLDIVGKTVNIPAMTGATAQRVGTSGLVPAPLAEAKDKFLKGDGTWATPPEVNLGQYYYDYRNNGLSARRTSGSSDLPYSHASLVGCSGNVNRYTASMTLSLDWSGVARPLFYIDTYDESASFIRFGSSTSGTEGYRYLLPRPVSNRVAMTNDGNKIVWGTIPSYASDPSVNNVLLLGDATGGKTWTALENDVVGTRLLDETGRPLLDEETGEPMYDASSTDQLWTGFAGKEFGAARAYADQDGNNIKATYATKDDLSAALGDIESLLAAL